MVQYVLYYFYNNDQNAEEISFHPDHCILWYSYFLGNDARILKFTEIKGFEIDCFSY